MGPGESSGSHAAVAEKEHTSSGAVVLWDHRGEAGQHERGHGAQGFIRAGGAFPKGGDERASWCHQLRGATVAQPSVSETGEKHPTETKGTTEHRREASHRSDPEEAVGGDHSVPRATSSTPARKRMQ